MVLSLAAFSLSAFLLLPQIEVIAPPIPPTTPPIKVPHPGSICVPIIAPCPAPEAVDPATLVLPN